MAVKIFEDHHEPLELELRDRNGKSHVVQTLMLTSGDIEEIELISKGKSKKKYKSQVDQIHAMLIMCCGKTKEFWSKFSLGLLSNITNYIIEEYKKKLPEQTG